MKKMAALFIIGLMLIWGNIAHAQEINEEYAYNLLHPWTEGFENGCENANQELRNLDTNQLKTLRELIIDDLDNKRGKVVQINYGPSYRHADAMIRTIDDLLGELSYDRVVKGEFVHNDEDFTTVARYDIKTESGEVIKSVIVGVSTLKPYCGYVRDVGIPYILYLKGNWVVKIELP